MPGGSDQGVREGKAGWGRAVVNACRWIFFITFPICGCVSEVLAQNRFGGVRICFSLLSHRGSY